jgi:aminoglycoside 3-N-acetyltransferase
MYLDKILENIPLAEVFIRNIYWRSKTGHAIISWLSQKYSKKSNNISNSLPSADFSVVVAAIKNLGVCKGDILIVHSAYGELRHFGLSPKDIVDTLKLIVGDQGTLVMPAFPIYKEEPDAMDRFQNEFYEKIFTYDVRKTRTWTGILPQTLLKIDGAIRSRHPLNTIVALGPHAVELTQNNLTYDGQTACGEGSSWAYCFGKNAKILMLGIDVVHSLTMIHVAEDLYENQWPVKGWYRNRQFRVIDNEFDKVVTIRERHPKWAIFYAERRFSKDLMQAEIVKTQKVEGLNISVCSSGDLLNYLNSRKESAYPFVIPFFPKKDQ